MQVQKTSFCIIFTLVKTLIIRHFINDSKIGNEKIIAKLFIFSRKANIMTLIAGKLVN
jgi:hypothetical protein